MCNRSNKNIDVKIKFDRDRKAFNDEAFDKYLRQVCKPIKYDIKNIVTFLKPWYDKGHKVLASLADSVGWNYSMVFPENYYAKHSSRREYSLDMQHEIDQVLNNFRKNHFIECPGYISRLGMKTAVSVVEDRKKQLEKKHQRLYTRKPDKLEREALNILSDFIGEIDPFLFDKFSDASYTVGESDEIIGELQNKRGYRDKNVFLSRKVFTVEFSDALAVLSHEWGMFMALMVHEVLRMH